MPTTCCYTFIPKRVWNAPSISMRCRGHVPKFVVGFIDLHQLSSEAWNQTFTKITSENLQFGNWHSCPKVGVPAEMRAFALEESNIPMNVWRILMMLYRFDRVWQLSSEGHQAYPRAPMNSHVRKPVNGFHRPSSVVWNNDSNYWLIDWLFGRWVICVLIRHRKHYFSLEGGGGGGGVTLFFPRDKPTLL